MRALLPAALWVALFPTPTQRAPEWHEDPHRHRSTMQRLHMCQYERVIAEKHPERYGEIFGGWQLYRDICGFADGTLYHEPPARRN